jgi:hypothetical protein
MPEPCATYRLEVRAEGAGPPADVRVRRLLKAMLRGYGLRCVAVEEVPPGPPPGPPDGPDLRGQAKT